jgi:hypothetical protein
MAATPGWWSSSELSVQSTSSRWLPRRGFDLGIDQAVGRAEEAWFETGGRMDPAIGRGEFAVAQISGAVIGVVADLVARRGSGGSELHGRRRACPPRRRSPGRGSRSRMAGVCTRLGPSSKLNGSHIGRQCRGSRSPDRRGAAGRLLAGTDERAAVPWLSPPCPALVDESCARRLGGRRCIVDPEGRDQRTATRQTAKARTEETSGGFLSALPAPSPGTRRGGGQSPEGASDRQADPWAGSSQSAKTGFARDAAAMIVAASISVREKGRPAAGHRQRNSRRPGGGNGQTQ